MIIDLYSKPGCGKCEAAKNKLKMMDMEYKEHNLEDYTSLHEGWRNDGSVDIMVAHTIINTLPIFRIGESFHDYPNAMRLLKSHAKEIGVKV